MAFRIECVVEGVEYRGMRSGVSQKTQKPWVSLVFEDAKCNQLEVSVPQEMQGEVYSLGLSKGDRVDVPIMCAATADGKSYVLLNGDVELVSAPTSEEVGW